MLAGLGSGASPTAGLHARKDSAARARRQAESLRKSRRSRKLHGGTKGCTLGGCRGAPARQSGRPSLAHLSCFINVRCQAQAIASTRKTMPGKSLFWRIRMRMRSRGGGGALEDGAFDVDGGGETLLCPQVCGELGAAVSHLMCGQ